MFTGLVQEIGIVRSLRSKGQDAELTLLSSFQHLELGESIAVNGTCLTVTRILKQGFVAGASPETLARTTLSGLSSGSEVHLERALRLGDRVGGHLVSGHVDGIGKKTAVEKLGDSLKLSFAVPQVLAPLIAPKGSIAIDGVSLTVNRVSGAAFDIVLVPYSREKTLLDKHPVGFPVNIEVDILAKYTASLLGKPGVDGDSSPRGLTLDLLAREGYL